MKKEEIRKKLHSIIDELESEEQLKNMLVVMEPEAAYYAKSWFEDLDEKQLSRLNKSLEQADKGEFISNESIKAKYAAWLK